MARLCRSPMPLILLVVGCSFGTALPPFDSDQARGTLVAALDAWKQGRVAELANRNPPLRFEDEDYRNALALTEYRFAKPEAPIRSHDDVSVVLVLRDRRGGVVEKMVAYQVTLAPHLAVLRND